MRIKIVVLFLIFALSGCNKKKPIEPKEVMVDTIVAIDTVSVSEEIPEKQEPPAPNFDLINDFPVIKDSAAFINRLKENRQIENNSDHGILAYKKVKIYGSKRPIVMVVYDNNFNNDKYQLVFFTEKGKYLKTLFSYSYNLLKVFPNENPLFVNLQVTNQGNGGHSFYKIENDSLVDVAPYNDKFINTFDRHQDNAVYEPESLNLSVSDENHDGYPDIVFKGKIVLIQAYLHGIWVDGVNENGKEISYSIEHPFKKIPIKFVLQYEPKTKTFVPKKDNKYPSYY